MKRFLIAGITAGATMLSLLPASADPLSQRDMVKVITQTPKRYLPSEPGKMEQLTLLFGPYEIPPGQDSNRILADVNLPQGFVKTIAPDLVDATTGRIPTEQEAHIHHAHWFRVTTANDCAADASAGCELYYTNLGGARDSLPEFVPPELAAQVPAGSGLSWVFGTGEEKTQGGFLPREAMNDADANGVPDVQYGMEIDSGERQVVIFMIHNKTAAPLHVFVVLDVDFVHGTADEISDATNIPMHPVKGQLWGTTKDATRTSPSLKSTYTAEIDGTAIVAGGHAHPGVYDNVLTNQGPDGKCTEDFDNDGYPGVSMLHARKIDHVPGSWPYSEDFQMGVAKYGWRANVHKGDKLAQIAPYDIDNEGAMASQFALPGPIAEGLGYPTALDLAGRDTVDGGTRQHYQAMNHYGMYVDPLQAPEAYSAELDENGCPSNFAAVAAPDLLGADTQAVQQRLGNDDSGIAPYFAVGASEGMQNHVWPALDPTCGSFQYATRANCENGITPATDGSGMVTDTIHIAGFQFFPGGAGLPGSLGAPAIVSKSAGFQIINEDVLANVRHTLTTCPWPCSGSYVANFPLQDGLIDTNKLGNIDPIEGSPVSPVYEMPASDLAKLEVGSFYSYYCRIHPSMRGSFQVAA